MPRCEVLIIFVVGLFVNASAMPQRQEGNDDAIFGLPFIQLTNDGVRFNFAGYHAEAGLGGLLDSSRTGGGLHASAGTPWGAHASAGLGGLLGGDDATARGGLYARAGLGNGRPEAGAGLGGILDGSGRSNVPFLGGLFAGATTGGQSPPPESSNGNGYSGSSASSYGGSSSGDDKGGKSGGSRTSIQIVSRSGKKSEKMKQQTDEVEKPANEPVNRREAPVKDSQQSPSTSGAGASMSGAAQGEAKAEGASASVPVEAIQVSNKKSEEHIHDPPPPYEANEVIQIANNYDREQSGFPRSSFRRRLRAMFPRRRVNQSPPSDSDVQGDSNGSARRMYRRQSGNPENYPPATSDVPEITNNSDNGFFDDVFNIPISTLTAVNQLLKNNSG